MKIIGLTGGIASGKSTVSSMLEELGAYIIDVDAVGKKVVRRGETAYTEIVRSFGAEILLPDGELNRKLLGQIVFSNKEKLALLNSITHPEMIKDIKKSLKKLAEHNTQAAVIDAAILVEMGLHELVDTLWLVAVDKETQIGRIVNRDKLSYEEAVKRISSQLSNEERASYADVVIDNSRPIEEVRSFIKELWDNIFLGEVHHWKKENIKTK